MTDLTRRQLFKAVFSAAATAALAKATALKLAAPLLTDVTFNRCDHVNFLNEFVFMYRISGRYHGPGRRDGEKAVILLEGTAEGMRDPHMDKVYFEMGYQELLDFVLENVAA